MWVLVLDGVGGREAFASVTTFKGVSQNSVIKRSNILMQYFKNRKSYKEIHDEEHTKFCVFSLEIISISSKEHLFNGLCLQKSFGCSCPSAAVSFAFVAGLNFLQHIRTSPEGYAQFTLSGDYYNRALSGRFKRVSLWDLNNNTNICLGLFLHKFYMREWGWGRARKDQKQVTA